MSMASEAAREALPVQLLTEEHALLLREVDGRVQRILEVLARGCWPDADIEALLAYLRYVVLDQAAHEEGLLYPLARNGTGTDSRLQRLSEDHAHLRDLTVAMADALSAAPGSRDPEQLASTLLELTTALENHLREEVEVLTPATPVGVGVLRRPLHASSWFLLTEGDVIDYDRLPPAFAGWAAVERLTRMRPGEHLEVRSAHSLETLHVLLRRRGEAATFGWAYLEEGPETWRAEITRRA